MPHRRSSLVCAPRTLAAALALALPLGLLFSGSAAAQSVTTPAATQADNSSAAVWRATSRLGYGPSPASAQAAQTGAKAWALQQIDAAFNASQKAPNIPIELAGFNAPVNDLARDYHAFTEERKRQRERPVAAAASHMSMASASATMAVPVKDEQFLREMVRTSAAWRIMSCSDAAIEQPLLAGRRAR